MAVLSRFLPPFSPDYSGVASAFFDMKCLSVLHDASGCTGNFTGYDEPRWYDSHSAVYCSGLRELDAVLGNDQKLIDRVVDACSDIHPEYIAIIGSPVPMVVGCDVAGIAHEIEETTGIPAGGFDATGTRYYDWGIALACTTVAKRFARPCPRSAEPSVNILGADAIDFGVTDSIEVFSRCVEENGFKVNACMPVSMTIDSVRRFPAAHINLVVSRSGLSTARLLEQKYGIPYIAGFPIGEAGERSYFSTLKDTAGDGHSRTWTAASHGGKSSDVQGRTLIIGEQVMSLSLRDALVLDGGQDPEDITVGCIFGKEEVFSAPQDVSLDTEKAIMGAMNQPDVTTVIADPLFEVLLRKKKRFISLPHYGVSSKLKAKDNVNLIGKRFMPYYMRALENS